MKHLAALALFGLGLLSARTGRAQTPAPALTTFAVGTGSAAATITVSALATGLDTPWELVWGPDNFIWMTERYGRISRVNPATGEVLPLLTLPDVAETGESGLLGLALHPQFAANPYVYVVYNYAAGSGLREKLVRYTYAAGAAGSLASPLVLLDNITAVTTHSGSRLLIRPDLTLLMTTGDAQQQPEAQNLHSLNGKVLRLNLDGSVPADNPTPGSLVYTLGHRNPQGLVQLPDGRLYASEHGPNNDDEINRLEPGRNYGWPNVEGYCNLPAEQAFCAAHNVREPLIAWTPTIAVAGLTYYDAPAVPAWRGSLLLVSLKSGRLTQLALDAAGNVLNSLVAPPDFLAGGFGRLRPICVSPQGRVYIGTSNKDGRGSPAATDDRILTLENGAYVATASATGALPTPLLALYPNPARQRVRVGVPAGARLTLLDATGRQVRQVAAPGPTADLELAGLAPGIYLVRAVSAAGVSTRRLVVEAP